MNIVLAALGSLPMAMVVSAKWIRGDEISAEPAPCGSRSDMTASAARPGGRHRPATRRDALLFVLVGRAAAALRMLHRVMKGSRSREQSRHRLVSGSGASRPGITSNSAKWSPCRPPSANAATILALIKSYLESHLIRADIRHSPHLLAKRRAVSHTSSRRCGRGPRPGPNVARLPAAADQMLVNGT